MRDAAMTIKSEHVACAVPGAVGFLRVPGWAA